MSTPRGQEEHSERARAAQEQASFEETVRKLLAHPLDVGFLRRELEEFRQRYASLVDIAPDAIVLSAEGVLRYANRAAAQLWAASRPEELLGRDIRTLVHPDFVPQLEARLRESIALGDRSDLFEHRIVRLDGSELEVESVASTVRYQGALARQTILRDVSERNERERRYRLLVEATEDFVFQVLRVDEEHVRVLWSTEREPLRSGLQPGDAVSLRDVLADGEPTERLRAALREGRKEEVILRGRLGNGAYRVVLEPCAPRPHEPQRFLVGVRDVSAERQAYEALEERERRLRELGELSQQLVYEVTLHEDDGFTVRWLTDWGAERTGLRPGQRVSGAQLASGWHPEDRPQRAERLARLRAGERDERQVRWALPSGEWRWVHTIEQPAGPGPDGEGLRVLGSTRDITHLKRESELLRELHDTREKLQERLLREMQLASAPSVQRTRPSESLVAQCFGVSPAMARVEELAKLATEHREPVLLVGETGTGKGHLAQWIHQHGRDAQGTFVALNCSTMRGELLLGELFGSARGAYTSSHRDRKGLVEEADGGTLFLDELGDMPLEAQSLLLKVLEEKTFRRLGEPRERRSDFRLLSATNRDLERDVQEGRFRRDLFYRVNVFTLPLPPLRERHEDLPALVQELGASLGAPALDLDGATLRLLRAQRWAGNIRELRNALIRALLLARGGPLRREHFVGLEDAPEPPALAKPAPVEAKPAPSEERSLRERLVALLQQHSGNRSRVAQALGVSRTTLYRYLERFGLGDGAR